MKRILTICAAAAVAVAFADNPYGACAHVTRGEPALRTCQMMRLAGMGWVRSDFDWSSIECRKGEWNFTRFDQVLMDCEAGGVQLLPILGYSVPWASPAHEHLEEWGEYVRRVMMRYGKRLPVLEVWNEENIPGFWKEPNPTNYLAVLRRTYEVAKSVEPKVRVAFGGTAGVPLAFIEGVYALGGAKCFDIMSIHPYSHPQAPEGRADAQIEALRDLMAKYGDEKKPLWITEQGWPTHFKKGAVVVNGCFERGLFGTSDEARQAKMVARALGIAFAEGVEHFFWYEFRQPDGNPYDPESYFGIVHDNFAPKPGYGAYMTFIDRRPAGSVQKGGVWRSADGTVYFPQWRRPDRRAAGMIWTTGEAREMHLAFTTPNVQFLDAAGTRVRPTRAGNVYTLAVGDAPIYFTGGELKTQAFRTAQVPIQSGETPAAYLERLRALGATARARDAGAVIGAGGAGVTDDFAKTFIGFGESEEIDVWQIAEPTPARVKLLRGLFDGAGGKHVRLVDGAGKALDAPAAKGTAKIEGKLPSPLCVAGTGRAYILEPNGKVSWARTGCGNIHRVQRHGGYVYYSNGDLWRCRLPGTKAELVYRPKERAGAGVLGFEVLPNGNIVIALNASGEIVELQAVSWRELVRFKVDVRNAKGETPGAHGRLRMIRKTPKGTYLVCCAGASRVREYDAAGKLVWEQEVPVMAFDCVRRGNGNTLVSHITGVTEYTPDHKVVWSFRPEELPALKLACLCGIQEKGGNLVIGSWANGEPDGSKATACEITRGKKLVWAWRPTADRNMMTAVR